MLLLFVMFSFDNETCVCCVTTRNMNLEGKLVWLPAIFMLFVLSLHKHRADDWYYHA
jgi:hypothetical protein